MPVRSHDFVGRREEITIIEQAISSREVRVVCIHGPGGIGKTSILKEIGRRYSNVSGIFVTRLIDFYKPGMHIAIGLMRRIADNLTHVEAASFESFYESYRDLEKMSLAGVSLSRLTDFEREVERRFFACYNSIAEIARIVLLIDTLEVVHKAPVLSWLIDKMLEFTNTTLLLAGRRSYELYERIKAKFPGEDRIQLLVLKEFTSEDTDALFEIADFTRYLSPDVKDKIQILSRGRPILLTLALDWRRRRGPTSRELSLVVEQYTLDELQDMDEQSLRNVRLQFERELVEGLTAVDPESQIFILMAYIHRRFNAEILSFLQAIGLEQAQSSIERIRDYPFVKYFEDSGECYLHDEMRRLVLEHVCRDIDRGWELRAEYARRMSEVTAQERHTMYLLLEGGQPVGVDVGELSYYGRRLWEINGDLANITEGQDVDDRMALSELQLEKRAVEAERVYYWLIADKDIGTVMYRESLIDDLWGKRRQSYELKRAERDLAVEELLWAYPDYELKFEQALVALLSEYDSRRYLGIVDEIDLEAVLRRGSIGEYTLAASCLTYSAYAYSENDLKAAGQSGQRAIELLRQYTERDPDGDRWLIDVNLARAYNVLGYANLRLERYAQAVEIYKKGVRYSRKSDAVALYAEILNSMAFAYGLLDQCLTARPLCDRGLRIRSRLGQEYSVGLSLNTLGQIYLFENRLDIARRTIKRALNILEGLGDSWGIGLSNLAMARVINVLAERDIQESQRTRTPSSVIGQEIVSLIQQGLDHAQVAEQEFTRSRSLARLAETHQTMASLRLMQARVTLNREEKNSLLAKVHELYQRAQKEYQDSAILLEQSFVLERWSRVYLEQRDYDGWMGKIQEAEQIAVEQSGDLRKRQDLDAVGRKEFLHLWGKIERAYGLSDWWQRRDLQGVAKHFVLACAFLEEYSDQSQTYRDTLDALTEILGELSSSELELVSQEIVTLQRKQFPKYSGILKRLEAATGVTDVVAND